MSRWIEDVRNHARTGTILALVGNKIDLEGERVVKKEEGEKLAKEFGAIFFETSAKANINID